MSEIHPQAVIDFVADNFAREDYFVHNGKVRINTPFKSQNPKPDKKFHLAVFLVEKNDYPVGSWNCFRSNRTGTFCKLVQEVRKCSYQEAAAAVEAYNKKHAGNTQLAKRFVRRERELVLPRGVSCIAHDASNAYLRARNLNSMDILKHNLYFCTEECRYKDRIVFPFFENGKAVFFTSRKLDDSSGQERYLHCFGSKSNCVYNIDDASLDPLVVVEGIFDAIMSNGVSIVGNKISEQQANKILGKKPKRIFAMMDLKTIEGDDDQNYYDNTGRVLKAFLQRGFKELYVLDPAKKHGFKDFGSLDHETVRSIVEEAVPLTIQAKLKFHIHE